MIKTTMGKIYAAFLGINQIRNQVRGMDALHLFHMKNMLKESVDYMAEEDVRMVTDAGGVITETGLVIIADKEKQKEYVKARKELDDMETEIQTDPVVILISRCPDVTVEQIERLEGFVIFKEDDDNGNK